MLLARKAPPAPAEMAGSAGREPTVIRTAESVVMTFGCSFVRNSREWQALTSQVGTCETVVTAAADSASAYMRVWNVEKDDTYNHRESQLEWLLRMRQVLMWGCSSARRTS